MLVFPRGGDSYRAGGGGGSQPQRVEVLNASSHGVRSLRPCWRNAGPAQWEFNGRRYRVPGVQEAGYRCQGNIHLEKSKDLKSWSAEWGFPYLRTK